MSCKPFIWQGSYAKSLTEYIKFGKTTTVELLHGTADPSAGAGLAASEGSLYLRHTGSGGELWQKQDSVTNTNWSQIVSTSGADNLAVNVPCDSGVAALDAVYIDSSGTAQKAIASSVTTARVIGLVETKPTSTTCNIRTHGESAAIFSSLAEESTYFLSTSVAGALQTTLATTAGHVIVEISKPLSSTKHNINIQERLIRS